MTKKNKHLSTFRIWDFRFRCVSDIPNPTSEIAYPLSILVIFLLFNTVLNAQAILKTYPDSTNVGGTSIGEYNNGANYLINSCTINNAKAAYIWTNNQGDLINYETDYLGSCGQYRIDSANYIKTQSIGNQPNRDIQLQKLRRDGAIVFSKTYPLPLDNFGQFVIPTTDGFLIAGYSQIPNDSIYKIQLIKTDLAGNLIWQKTIPNIFPYGTIHRPSPNLGCYDVIPAPFARINNLVQTTNGFFLIYDTYNAAQDCNFGSGIGNFIVRFDANGNFLWIKGENIGALESNIIKAKSAEDGNIIMAFQKNFGDTRTCTGSVYNLMKINTLGDTLWTFSKGGTSCSPSGNQYLNVFNITANGDILAQTTAPSSAKPNVVRKIKGTTGQQIDSIAVSLPSFATVNQIIETQDGRFALTGRTNISTFFYKDKFTSANITTSDIALSITTTPSVYRQFTTQNFKITAKNTGNQVFTNVKITFPFPAKTVTGGTVITSTGMFQEWCAGGQHCFIWTIPSLAVHELATLDVPVYVLDVVNTMTATATLVSSNPIDTIAANNVATIGVNPSNTPFIQTVFDSEPTQLMPIMSQKISPTITSNYIIVELESTIDKTIDFKIINSLGNTVLIEKKIIEKGKNRFNFGVENLPKGMYFIQTSVDKAYNMPIKFIKF